MAGVTLPVRMEAKSSLATTTAFSIFSSASKRISSITSAPVACSSPAPGHGSRGRGRSCSAFGRADQRADLLTSYGPDDIALAHEVENDDGQPVVHAEADGRGVHD